MRACHRSRSRASLRRSFLPRLTDAEIRSCPPCGNERYGLASYQDFSTVYPRSLSGSRKRPISTALRETQKRALDPPSSGFLCLGAVTSRGDLRHLAKLFRHRPDQADFAADQGDLPFVERTGVEGHQEDRLMDRDAFVEIMEEGQDRAEVVVAHEVFEAVQEDGRTLARLDEMFDRHGVVLRRTRPDH